jgi:SAM-dependent methyltransferase
MNPEVMAYAMELLKKDCHEQTGKIALEIGAASGENSIILAFSDVEKVYANEINSKEIQQFGTLKSDLPQGVKKKLESIEGSCFDLLKINPELKNTIDLILCRNVIHFFTLKEHVEFFKLIHSLLKPGGRGIFTVNSTYAYLEHNSAKKCFKKNPDQACFRDLSCFIYDNRVSNMPSKCIYNQISPWPQEAFSLDVVKNFIFRRSKETNFKWKVYNENLAQLDSAVQSKIISAYKKHKKKIQVIKHGSVQISITNTNIYNEQTLTRLFRNRGLEIESLFHVNRLGHLVDQREAPMKGYQIGIVCKKPVS